MMRAIVLVASVFAFDTRNGRLQAETETQEPVRPVLSTVVQADRAGRHYSCGYGGTAVQDGSQFPRAGPPHRPSRECRGYG